MKTTTHTISLTLCLILSIAVTSCDENDPRLNTPTSGRLVLYVEPGYAPLFGPLVDSFEARTPATSIEVREIDARQGVTRLLNDFITDTARADTSVSVALIMGRRLLDDEREAIVSRGLENRLYEMTIGHDALAVAVPESSSLQQTTVGKLRQALVTERRTDGMLGEGTGGEPVRFILPDPNSSAFHAITTRVLDSGAALARPVRTVGTADSVASLVAAGEGIGIAGWYPLQRNLDGIRILELGGRDSTGAEMRPVRVHVTSLVMGLYPLKMPIVGYTVGGRNSLGNGFLNWIALSTAPQQYLVEQGLEGENVRYRFERQEP